MMEVNGVSEVIASLEVNDNSSVGCNVSGKTNVVNAKPHFAPLGQRTPLTSITSSKAITSTETTTITTKYE